MSIGELRQLRIDITASEIDISYRLDRIQVDITEPLADIGLKGVQRLNRELSQRARQAVDEGIAKTARQGDRHRREITSKAAVLLEPPAKRSTAINVDTAPKDPPVLSVQSGWFQLASIPGSVNIELVYQKTTKHSTSRAIDVYT
jgi:hypothetical protein